MNASWELLLAIVMLVSVGVAWELRPPKVRWVTLGPPAYVLEQSVGEPPREAVRHWSMVYGKRCEYGDDQTFATVRELVAHVSRNHGVVIAERLKRWVQE